MDSLTISVSNSISPLLIPQKGEKIATTVMDDLFPVGFVGKVCNIEEKDSKIYLEILSKNNIIIYLYKLLSNIIEISKDEFNLTKNIIISNIYIIILNYLEIIN